MGERRLTIALPTYNRAQLLEAQLAWLTRALKGRESAVEVLIADNCSTDATPDVIDRWISSQAPSLDAKLVRRDENIGAVRNIFSCIRDAGCAQVWAISDDDEIDDDAVEAVLRRLEQHPDLSLLQLNFSSRMHDGERLYERCFDVFQDTVAAPGQELFEQFLAYRKDSRWGGLLLTTALVYRTATARAALDSWPGGLGNELVQLYVSAYCAQQGKMLVTGQTLLESIAGRAHFAEDPVTFFSFRTAHTSEAFIKLAEIGYSRRLILRKLLERPGAFLKMAPRAFRSDPAASVKAIARYVRALGRAIRLSLGPAPDPRV